MIFEKFKKDMEGRGITKQEGGFSLLIFGGIFQCAFPPYFNRYYDFSFKSFVFLMKRMGGTVFFDLKQYFNTTTASFYKFFKTGNKKKLPEYNDFLSILKKVNQLYQNSPPEKITEINDEKLEAQIKESFSLLGGLFGATVFCESLDEKLIHKFYKEIKGEENEFNNFFNFGSKVGFESFVAKFDKSLLFLKENNDFYQCQWILSNYYICPDLNEIETSIKKLINKRGGFEKIKDELGKISQKSLIDRKEIENYRKSISGSKKYLFDYIQLCIFVRDARKEPILKLITLISNLSREIFKRAGLAQNDIVYGFYNDFTNGFYKKDNYINEIKKRKKGVAVYCNKKRYEFEYGNTDKIKEKIYGRMDKNKNIDVKEIKGSIGNKGKVKAVASVILNESEFSRFISGNVLVTSMTRAEFVPLMKKASAIVTDEGGITCHAAIISRELKKPCIIGTKNATRILKDGDLVEVDADKGVVRIIEKAK